MTDKAVNYQQALTERLNSIRLARALDVLPDLQQKLFHVIPFLIHYNQIDTPSIIDPSTPCGVHGFTLSNAMISACDFLGLTIPESTAPSKAINSNSAAFEGVYAKFK